MRVFRLDVHGSPLQELKSRGVLDENIVPVYPYRDDAVLLYKILNAYVDRNLRVFYGPPRLSPTVPSHPIPSLQYSLSESRGSSTPPALHFLADSTDKLASDYEIQQLRTELVTPVERGGAGIAVRCICTPCALRVFVYAVGCEASSTYTST